MSVRNILLSCAIAAAFAGACGDSSGSTVGDAAERDAAAADTADAGAEPADGEPDDAGDVTDVGDAVDTAVDVEDAADAAADAAAAADVGDPGPDVADLSDAPDGADAIDASDDTDAADGSDAGDAPEETDVADAADALDATDVADAADVVDADLVDAADETDGGPPDDGATPISFDPATLPLDPAYDLGVQAGAMRADSFVAWTHTTGAPEGTLRVWREGGGEGEVLLVRDIVIVPDASGYVHIVVDGLLPGTWYEYAFLSGPAETDFFARSPVARVRTALAPGAREPLTVAATSCTNEPFMPYEAIEAMADRDIDLLIHTGDQSYNDDDVTLAEYRARWRGALNDPGYRAIHEAAGHYSTWDDHEVTDNWNPETIDPARRDAAFQAYFETLAVERQESGALWYSYRWGDTAEFIVLDCRGERRPSTRGDEDIYISREQMDWLKETLRSSTAHFKVVLNSVPITDMPPLYVSEGDRWEGYGRQRSELLDFIVDEEVSNVWFVSGDFHIGMVTRVNDDGGARRIIEVAAGPGGNSNPAASALGFLETLAGTDQIIFHTGSFHTEVLTLLTFDPERDQVRVVFELPGGEVLFDRWMSEGD